MRFHCANALVVLGSCALRGTLMITTESARFDKNYSEPKSQVRLLKFPEENYNFSKTRIVKSILPFCQCQNENECFSQRQLQTTK